MAPIAQFEPSVQLWSEGYFDGEHSLAVHPRSFLSNFVNPRPPLPYGLRQTDLRVPPSDAKMERDGWQWVGKGHWKQQPGDSHPTLERRDFGHHAWFQLEGYPELLDDEVTWATYDFVGDLLVGRAGLLQRFRLIDIELGKPCFEWDLTTRPAQLP